MKESGIEWIGKIPEHWKISNISKYIYVTKLAGFEFSKYMKYILNGEIIALRALNIKNSEIDLDNIVKISKKVSDKLPRSKLNKNDIIFTYVGAKVGAVAIIDQDNTYHLAPNIAKLTITKTKTLTNKYLLYYLSSYSGQEGINIKVSKSGQEVISMEKIRRIKLPIPPLNEQKDINEYLNNNNNKNINTTIEKIEKNIELLEEYKESLIHHVVTGKIDVRSVEL